MKFTACIVVIALTSPIALAQTGAGQKIGLSQYIQAAYAGIKRDLAAAAERMPEADYGFKPSQMPETRTYGAVIAHAADGMFASCATAKGVKNPASGIARNVADKAAVVKALADSIAYCDVVFSTLTDRSAAEHVRHGPFEIPRAAVLMGVLAHNAEMYGISTVYLRARNLVPPASDPR